jgi:hypothetical protein
MSMETFRKILSANDVGSTGAHQAGILIPKGEKELLRILPPLDPSIKNPDAMIQCVDDKGEKVCFRFVYYNNRLHDSGGTRNEYRVTRMTGWFRDVGAREGDEFEISKNDANANYEIRVHSKAFLNPPPDEDGVRIKLTKWRRIH